VIGAILLARQGALDEKTAGSTQLWVLPVESPNQPSTSIRLGVQSSELTVFSYRLEVQVEGNNVFQVPKIQLEPGQKWELTTDLKLDLSTVQEIKVLLYLLDNNDKVYRNVTLKLNTSTRK
jgi:hypothetical protein